MTAVAEKQAQNGVNVAALLGAREALGKAPEAARFNWRATCKWMHGTHSRTSVKGYYGLGQEQSHKTEFTFDMDHPEIVDFITWKVREEKKAQALIGAAGVSAGRRAPQPNNPGTAPCP